MKKVIVMGGGLAGLACADEILRKGQGKFDVLVLEKEAYLGGLSATFNKNSFRFDLAPHRWFTKNEELNHWLDDLMVKEIIEVEKYTPMFQFNKFFKYPIEVFDVLKKINIFKMISMLVTFVWARISQKLFKKKIVNMKDAYTNRFGYSLYKWFCEEYNEKLWGKGGCEILSADWVNQRTKDLSMASIVKTALGLEKKVISLTPKFRFPKLGIGRISDNLEKRIKKNNGQIKRRVLIRKIIKEKSGYRLLTNQGDFKADQLISSIPLDDLIRLLKPKAPQDALEAVNNLQFVSQKIVTLLANKSKLTNFTWVYIHPPTIKTFRMLETNNWSTAMSPKGKTSLVFEYPYHSGSEIETMVDKELIDLTISDFIKYFSPQTKKKDFLKGYVFSVNKAYPKYVLGYSKPLKKIKSYLNKNHSRLQLIGRGGRFRYNNMDHSIYTGILAAKNIVAGKNIYDLDRVNNKAEYLEEKEIKR